MLSQVAALCAAMTMTHQRLHSGTALACPCPQAEKEKYWDMAKKAGEHADEVSDKGFQKVEAFVKDTTGELALSFCGRACISNACRSMCPMCLSEWQIMSWV